MKRTFIAFKIPLPQIFENYLDEMQQYFSDEPVKWVSRSNMHVTLSFLGDTSARGEQQVRGLLSRLTAVSTSFCVRLSGAGAFPSASRPQVLWFGVEVDQELIKFQQTLHNELSKIDFELDKRKYNPHLTVGRVKGGLNRSFSDIQQQASELKSNEIKINEIIFFESHLTGKNPVYLSIQKFPMKGQQPI
ncbi:MAG: RNA 2',3'-cyclic phosphodiesterase [Bacteroidetes bacterium]|jgi:2'-5' RNA ligase|nr:RNA 2',3'-cyclic phosphodiesterase [Bacteroidota bacterium]